ncbi:MAG: plasmid stabilization protein [Rhodobacteraceae bacterium]|nr:MAG: plasmid stabilization protein [Paracoccaceae bacterium]
MVHAIFADMTSSITELKKNPMGTVAAGNGRAVAILNRNEPAFYCVPADEYQAMVELLEDMELNAIADSRANEVGIPVDINDL